MNLRIKMLSNKYARLAVAVVLYLLWIIWLGNYWLLFGLPIFYDIYISKKVRWAFWKPKDKTKKNKVLEWLDALIFAAVVVSFINIFFFQNYKIPTPSLEKSLLIGDHLFVSKYSYGPKVPNTPLSFPFIPHTLPFTDKTPSYLSWLKWDYHRLGGLTDIKRDDIVVFNFPEGDTVLTAHKGTSYYDIVTRQADGYMMRDKRKGDSLQTFATYMSKARKNILAVEDFFTRPQDKTDNYVKRCVAIAGDEFKIVEGDIYVNGKKQKEIPGVQYNYFLRTANDNQLSKDMLEELNVRKKDINYSNKGKYYYMPLSNEAVQTLNKKGLVKEIQKALTPKENYTYLTFPHHENFKWNQDNYGPLTIPKKGETVTLTVDNLPLYQRLIQVYEHNKLEVKGDKIFVNDKEVNSYTFKMDYYFMMGDNRHNSLDSRFWGFVPEDRVVGKPIFVYLSLNEDKGGFGKIRWNRFFKKVK